MSHTDIRDSGWERLERDGQEIGEKGHGDNNFGLTTRDSSTEIA